MKRIGITMGDPAGIGPEIVIKAIAQFRARRDALSFTPIVYGVPDILRSAAEAIGLDPEFTLSAVAAAPAAVSPGVVSRDCGRLAYLAVEQAVSDAMRGAIDAIVTGPISKEALNLAGYLYAGHTEMLAKLSGSPDSCMMLAHGRLRVSHVSTHVPLSRVPELVTRKRVDRVIELTVEALGRLGVAEPRIGVAALNPHAGEGGLFGREDAEVIAPTVEAYRQSGLDVRGPISGDTIFVRALAGEFDAVVAMFHDQGHIPVKLLGFQVDSATGRWTALHGVNVTLGLPFIRTSVDHGTAFDIAGLNVASAQSMVEAIEFALNLMT